MKRSWFIGLTLILAAFIFPPPSPGQILPFEVIGLERGLPQSQVNSVVQDNDGYIWVGTWGGLARYDGLSFVEYTRRNGLPGNRIHELLRDRRGGLWIATTDGIALWKDRRFQPIHDPLVQTVRCRALAEDHEGTLWIGTDRGPVTFHDGRFAKLTLTADAGSPVRVFDLFPEGEGVMAATAVGLQSLDRSGRTFPIPGPPVPPDTLRNLLFQDGILWVGTEGNGLWKRDGKAWNRCTLGDSRDTSVYSISTDRSGTLYVCTTSEGVYLKARGETSFRHWGTENGLPSRTINSVYEDREGNLWIGTDMGGLARLGGAPVTNYGAVAGFPDRYVFGISRGGTPETLWAGTTRGAALLQTDPIPKVLETITRKEGLDNEWIWKVLETPAGEVWLMNDLGYMVRKAGARKVERPPAEVDILLGMSFDMALDEAGRLWLAGEGKQGGLFMRDTSGNWRHWDRAVDGTPLTRCRRLAPGRSGMWVCTEPQRLAICDGNEVRIVTSETPLSSGAVVTALFEDRSGRLWLGIDGGLAVRDPQGSWEVLDERPGFANRHVYFLGQDLSGEVWVGTARGVYRFHPDGSVRAMTPEDGLASFEVNSGGFYCDPKGSVWIGSVGGLSRYDSSQSRPNMIPPKLMVESADYPGGTLAFPQSMVLRWRQRSVTFKVALLAHRGRNRSGYRARLEGIDEEWLPLRSASELRYTNLPAGNHILRVQPVNESGVWGEEVQLPIQVVPPFWMTGWFLSLLGIAIAAGAWSTHRARVRHLEARGRELEAIVDARTHDLRKEKECSEEARRQAEEASRVKGMLLARLEEAQNRIEALQRSSEGALADMASWTRAVTADVATAIGASGIQVWRLKDGAARGLSDESADPPPPETIDQLVRRQETVSVAGVTFVPIAGLSGEVVGLLGISGSPSLGTAENHLVATLAHQLGETIELQRIRQELEREQAARAARRQELAAAGIEIVRLCPSCGRCFGSGTERCPEHDAPLSEEPGEMPYILRERYRLVRLLAQGGMGKVFAAKDERLDREVAIKIVRPEHFHNSEMRLRFEQEARAVARIQHHGVLSLFDSGELDDGSTFLVMELLRGCDLSNLIARWGRGSLHQVASLTGQAGAALNAAHRAGLVHRDVKPANLFLVEVTDGFTVKILDFGIAKPVNLESALTQTGTLLGTPAYMSPEQLQGLALDLRSDVYSLATVAFEALTGQRYVRAREFAEICVEILSINPPSVLDFRPNVPEAAERILQAALAKDRDKRPSSIEDWSRQLAAALLEGPEESGGWPIPFDSSREAGPIPEDATVRLDS